MQGALALEVKLDTALEDRLAQVWPPFSFPSSLPKLYVALWEQTNPALTYSFSYQCTTFFFHMYILSDICVIIIQKLDESCFCRRHYTTPWSALRAARDWPEDCIWCFPLSLFFLFCKPQISSCCKCVYFGNLQEPLQLFLQRFSSDESSLIRHEVDVKEMTLKKEMTFQSASKMLIFS